MATEPADRHPPRFWVTLIAIVILLIFLYFYQPFETYLLAHIPGIRFANVLFWFASLVGVVGYIVAHWQSFRRHILQSVNELQVDGLIFDTLQVAILTAIIFAAGAILQAVEKLGEHLVNRGTIIDGAFGMQLLAIILLVLLAIVFFLLHHLVRSFRTGWAERRPAPRMRGAQPPS